jgi:hypothetical protein
VLHTEDVQMGTEDLSCQDIPEPLPPPLTNAGRPQRAYRLPARYNDIQPTGPAPLPPVTNLPPVPPGSYALPRVILHVQDFMRTGCNRFGLLREYAHRPSYDPDSVVSEDSLSNYPSHQHINSDQSVPKSGQPPPWPFRNMSIYLLMEWMITGGNRKTIGEMDRLAKEVLHSESFKVEDLAGFNARQENRHLDLSDGDDPESPYSCDGWVESAVQISMPTGSRDGDERGNLFMIPGLHHRSLVAVMKAALTDVTSRYFHFSPFKRFWKPRPFSPNMC